MILNSICVSVHLTKRTCQCECDKQLFPVSKKNPQFFIHLCTFLTFFENLCLVSRKQYKVLWSILDRLNLLRAFSMTKSDYEQQTHSIVEGCCIADSTIFLYYRVNSEKKFVFISSHRGSYLDYPNVLCCISMTQLDTCVKKTTRHNTTQTTHTKNIFSSCYRTRGVYTGI